MNKNRELPECRIRTMQEADREEVLEMMRVFYDSPAICHTASDAVLERDVQACLDPDPLLEGFVFDTGNGLAGYAMTALNYTTEYGGVSVWLEDLYLRPEYRHCGIGSRFFDYMKEHFPQAVRFKLEVEPEHETAIAMYKRNGYVISPYYEMTLELIEDN